MLFLLSLPYCKKLFSKINYTLFQADHSSPSCLECPAGKYKAEAGPGPCEVCPIGKYKPEAGPGSCQVCPPHSKARFRGSAECRCLRGYYRGRNDDQRSACTKPPTSPRNLIFFSHIYLARVAKLMTKSFGFCASARLATGND